MPCETVSGSSFSHIRLSELGDRRVAAGEHRDQLAAALRERAQLRVGGVGALLHLGAQGGEDLGPLALDVADRLVAERPAALLELLELVGGVVALTHGQLLDRGQEVADLEALEQRAQLLLQPALLLDLGLEPAQVVLDGGARVEALGVERLRDRVEREAEAAQRHDPVEALDGRLVIDAMAALRALGGEQADLVVMVQRAHGQARAPRQLADLPHGEHGMPSRYVRCKP